MEKKPYPLRARGKALEDRFFFEKDRSLAKDKERLRKMELSLKTFSEISGIADEAILRKLAILDIQVEVLATLSVIPLIHAAWADGKMDDPGREATLKAAETFGVLKGRVTRDLLEHGLRSHPPKGLIESWIFYMQGLCQLLEKDERRMLKKDFLRKARAIAEAEGGKLKTKTKISRRKEEALLLLEQAFEPLAFRV